jgi:hypothetical protein
VLRDLSKCMYQKSYIAAKYATSPNIRVTLSGVVRSINSNHRSFYSPIVHFDASWGGLDRLVVCLHVA